MALPNYGGNAMLNGGSNIIRDPMTTNGQYERMGSLLGRTPQQVDTSFAGGHVNPALIPRAVLQAGTAAIDQYIQQQTMSKLPPWMGGPRGAFNPAARGARVTAPPVAAPVQQQPQQLPPVFGAQRQQDVGYWGLPKYG